MESEKYEITLDIKSLLEKIVGSQERLELMYQEAKADESCGFADTELTRGEFYLGYFMKVAGTLEHFGISFQQTPGLTESGIDLISSAYIMTTLAQEFIQKYVPKMALEMSYLKDEVQEQVDYGKRFSPKMEEN